MPMTVRILRVMRHIPEEELHAYLDQALSRSQCVEIESHLAECFACRGRRDGIAALRDRTTALLATLTPGRAVTPPFELIEARRAAAAVRRHERMRRAAWAASLIVAVGAGWGLNHLSSDRAAQEAAVALPPAEAASDRPSAPAADLAAGQRPEYVRASELAEAPEPAASRSADAGAASAARLARGGAGPAARSAPATPRAASPAGAAEPSGGLFTVPSQLNGELAGDRSALGARFAAPQSLQVSSSQLSDGLALEGVWRTVSWENAQEEAGGAPAHVDGLPVMQVQVQQATSGKPLMVVAQQLGSGDVIRTIEGPAAEVSSLLRRTSTPGSSPWPTVEPGDAGTVTSTDGSIVTMQGDRILAISAPGMSSDSLAAIARRVNAARAGGAR